jgi:asparagine synthetase B (glutamine-hydrolysing)
MPGILGCFGKWHHVSPNSLISTINLLSSCEIKKQKVHDGFLAASWRHNDLLSSSRCHEDSKYTASFSGDLVNFHKVPWNLIITDLRNKQYHHFSRYRGPFAIGIFDKIDRQVFVISDRTSQQPIYYSSTNDAFMYSTAISSYCKLPHIPKFNVTWLYDFLFFNYPVGDTTFLTNVLRMPPASILQYDLAASKASLFQYAKPFEKVNALVKGSKAFEKALSVFSERLPQYFESETEVAVSLTGGLDSRTVLSFVPPQRKRSIVTYTYGLRGCTDLAEASKVTSVLKLPHIGITFDDSFLHNLQKLIYETVYLSNGLERVTRSTLPYVYRVLTNHGHQFPIIVTGLSGDHLFRDHIMGGGNVPSLISSDMMQVFRTGRVHISKSFFRKAYGENFSNFEDHIYEMLDFLKSTYEGLHRPESYLSYLIYEIAPKYFAGEAAIANNYSTFRTPYWDTDIVKLSYEIAYGTLGFSESSVKQDKYRQCVLQTFLIQRNETFSKIPLHHIPLKLFSNNDKLRYNLYRIIQRGPQKIKKVLKPFHPPLEDWSTWFDTVLDREIAKLISKESLISYYLTAGFLEEVKQKKDVHWLGKIVTAEIILRLIKDRWEMKSKASL